MASKRIPFVESKILPCYARPGDRTNAPRRGERSESTEESLIPKVVASCVLWARRGAKIGDGENLCTFKALPNGKTYFQRCIGL